MKGFLVVGVIFGLLGCTSAPDYDHSNKLGSYDSEKCTKAKRALISFDNRDYQKTCEGRSAEFEAFIVEKDSDEYVANLTDPKSTSYQFDKESNFSLLGYEGRALGWNDKYRIRGVFGSRSYSSGADFYIASATKVELTQKEQEERAAGKAYEEVKRLQEKGLAAYWHCADKVMAEKNFTVECPKPKSYSSARAGEDGSILIKDGMCFFGKSTVLFDCAYKYGSATIESTKVIGG